MTRPLTESEEQSLAARIVAGDKAARDELIMRHANLVHQVSGRLPWRYRADAVGEGMLALVHAANAFRPGMGRFADIASTVIRRAVRRRLRATKAESISMLPSSLHPTTPGHRERPDRAVLRAVALRLTEDERDVLRGRHKGEPARRTRRRAEAKLRDELAKEV